MTTEEIVKAQSNPVHLKLDYADEVESVFLSSIGEVSDDSPSKKEKEAHTKKERILALYQNGITDIARIAREAEARPSYVAQVLQSEGLISGYFDLYTTTGVEQNVYSRFFRNVLSFKTVEAARESVRKIDRLYNYFERLGDRAGQHQAMVVALIGKNRARWSGKKEEAQVFSDWLAAH
jgi:hypothetical protein